MTFWIRAILVWLSCSAWWFCVNFARTRRMVFLLTILFLVSCSTVVFANPCGNNTTGNCVYNTPTNSPSSTSNAASASGAASNSTSNSASLSGASATAGVGPITNGATATGGQGCNANQKQTQGQETTIQSESTYQAARIPVATAYAAALTSGQCGVGSTSGGVQTPLIGATFGTTHQDRESKEYCRKVDRVRFGFMVSPVLGCFVLKREFPEIREAMLDSGQDCLPDSPPPPPPPTIVQGYTQEQMDEAVREALARVPACPKPAPKRKGLSKRRDILTLPDHCSAPTHYKYQ